MEQFKYLEKTLMNQNPIQEEIKIKWKLGNACCYWCRIFCLLFCYPKIKEINVHRTIILPVVLYGYESWWLTLTEDRWLRVFENRVLRRIFGPRRDKVMGYYK
jgi:hypothetical protein